MNIFTQSVSRIMKGALKAFQTFPVAIGCALAFAIVTMIRIQLDWPQQEPYNFLFNSLHWAFALGAVFSLAAITAAQSRYNDDRAFKIANLLGVVVTIVTFLLLYLFGGTDSIFAQSSYNVVSDLAAARVSAAILVSFIAFIILASYPKDQSDFSRSFFMTHKAFFIALLYGLVIMAGVDGVAGAIQALLYNGMSGKAYMYIGTLSGFLAFTIFAGYFPDFRKGEVDERRKVAQDQPRFIEILFEYIMIPIMIALTVVLLLWAGKTVLDGMKVSFVQLSGIATAYTIFGVWLHVMVTHNETGLAKFYRRMYPFAALVILAFEAWNLLLQLEKSGLKMTEYSFIMIWIVALAAAILLIALQDRAHRIIAVLACVIAVLSVLPMVGYHALPVTSQVNRLENLLISQKMLKDNQLIKAAKEPERAVRESITDAVNYLAYTDDAKLPDWFDKRLSENGVFIAKLGFEQTWPNPEDMGNGGYMGTNLMLPSGALDISGYQWFINLQQERFDYSTSIQGNNGEYQIYWTVNQSQGIPTLKILLNDRVILEESMKAYLDKIAAAYPPGEASREAKMMDMSLQFDNREVTTLIVFRNISINLDPQNDTIYYWLDPSALYLNEKP